MPAFPDIAKIKFEGPDSKNHLAFRHYNPDELVEGRSMRDHLRFAVCYWHTFRGTGGDPFGPGCAVRPWEDGTNTHRMDLARIDVAFEFMEKLGVPYYCFHDRDISGEGDDLKETNQLLDKVVAKLKTKQQETGIKLLWGTANLFSNPRFVHGASTSCNADVFAYSAAQVKKALEVTKELGGENYVFWGGREGYMTLWNTDLKRELDHLAKFFHMAVDYKKKIGFTGKFLIEPKPHEPTSHQYDFDVANSLAFLRGYGLEKEFAFNVETNHATLARHTMGHELALASLNGMLGSIDANRGDLLLGWDTDQFPTDLYLTAQVMLIVLGQGGLDAVHALAQPVEPLRDLLVLGAGQRAAPTSAAWTPSPTASRSPPPSARTASSRTSSPSATPPGTPASASRSTPTNTTSLAWKRTCSTKATRRRTPRAVRR